MQKPFVQMTRAGGANDTYLISNGVELSRNQLYLEDLQDPNRSREPELRFDCFEAINNWLDDQTGVIGCQFHLWEPEMLERLSGLEFCNFVVHGEDWMKPDSRNSQRRNDAKQFYSSMKALPETLSTLLVNALYRDLTEDEANRILEWLLSPVFVYHCHPNGYQYPLIMHHKFMVGIKPKDPNSPLLNELLLQFIDARQEVMIENLFGPDGVLSLSAIYGSFNMSPSAALNLESIMIFRENDQICLELIREWMRTRTQSVPFAVYFNGIDVNEFCKSAKQVMFWRHEG